MAGIEIKFEGNKVGLVRLPRFADKLPSILFSAIDKAGALLEADMVQKVSGPGRWKGSTHGPISRLNQFPGVGKTGHLKRGIRSVTRRSGRWIINRTGPNVFYARFLELGTKRMPQGYPFIRPTWNDKKKEVTEIINDGIFREL